MPDSSESGEDRHLPRWNKLDDLEDARRRQMRAVKTAERIMYEAYEAGKTDLALTASTRLTQAVRCYLKVMEATDFEKRIERLEEALNADPLSDFPGGDGQTPGPPEAQPNR